MTERRSRERRRRKNNDERWVWLNRIWAFVARPWFVGILVVVAGFVVALAPTATVPSAPSQGWWVAAYRFSNATQGAVTLLIAAGLLGLAVGAEALQSRRARTRRLAGISLIGLGIVSGLLTWFVAQADVPTSRVAIAPGQTIEAYPAIESGRAFKVMLPTRIFVASVNPEAGKATIELRRPGEDTGIANDVFVGDPLEIAGYRLALVGLELDPRALSAVLTTPDGIERRASVRSRVRFVPDGPEYEVRRISANYLGLMGPAAEIAGPDEEVFWLTQRGSALENPLNDVQLLRLESAPVPVFALTKTNAGAAAPAVAIVFMLGVGLLLVSVGRRVDVSAEKTE